ncbi:MAG: M20/M25/M40 family metallo-hydrolase, partial [Abditibacteriota bacterium]|nr:M20/M25/M40 family metallo-hydrolase [Abditibacteriota bacterium]
MRKARINWTRLLSAFRTLARIPGPSASEGLIASRVARRAEALGFSVYEDGAGKALGREQGNLICSLPGSGSPLILNAHLDTVESTEGLELKEDGDRFYTGGSTILGADDRAGAAAILEAAEAVLEAGIPRGPLYLVFTVGEEQGLLGAEHLETGRLPKAPWYSFDAGKETGACVFRACGRRSFDLTLKGPEAVRVMAKAIDSVKWGRTPDGGSANPGVIKGGSLPGGRVQSVCLQAAVRSFTPQGLDTLEADIKSAFAGAARAEGCAAEITDAGGYPPLASDPAGRACTAFLEAAAMAGLRGRLEESGGGYDANRLSAAGWDAVAVG